jgi:hypothetical protein
LAVAVNAALPLPGEGVAVTVWAPARVPNVHSVAARPFAPVVALAGETDPPPVDAAKFTVTPSIGFPSESLI